MREAVRSGRRAGFYMTENSFIDDYARDVGTTGVAVYHVLERHVNCETRSTWIGTAKMAKPLNVDQRTIQRTIKKLESLRLIRIVRSENMTTFYIMPVPPRGKTTTSPLFDEMPVPLSNVHDTEVAIPTHESRATTFASPTTTLVSRKATFMSQTNDIPVALYKEEQDLLNKTQEQDSFNKSCENKNTEVKIAAKRILNTLSLPATSLHAAIAAVELKAGGTDLSMDAVVQEISTEAHLAYRRRVSAEEFLVGFLA